VSDVLLNPSTLSGAPRAQLARLCRQICLSREQGKISAGAAEEEFLRALESVRASSSHLQIHEQELREIVSVEEHRVADAAILAELIASKMTVAQAISPSATTEPTATPTTVTARANTPSAPVAQKPAVPLGIADFIDGMLAQEKQAALNVPRA
jgi:hypothetical protein